MSDELNVWRELFQEFQALRRASCLDEAEQEAAAVIRTYGDKRYQQAIADVVEWLRKENGLCDCYARSEGECGCGAWGDYKQWPLERTADAIEAGEWK